MELFGRGEDVLPSRERHVAFETLVRFDICVYEQVNIRPGLDSIWSRKCRSQLLTGEDVSLKVLIPRKGLTTIGAEGHLAENPDKGVIHFVWVECATLRSSCRGLSTLILRCDRL